jgi:hypothetical protein
MLLDLVALIEQLTASASADSPIKRTCVDLH